MSMKKTYTMFCFLVALLSMTFPVSDAQGAGFGIFTQGASGLGQADAIIAHGDTPSAMFLNPALINQLPGTQLEAGTTLLMPSRKFTSSLTGNSFQAESEIFYPSTVFLTHRFSETVSAGIGIFSPFGLGTVWPDNGEGRYIATKSEMKTFNFNPVVSVKVTPDITFAVGADYVVLDAKLEKKVNLSALGLPDASQRFRTRGTNDGWGYNLGALIDLGKGVSAGASYRSGIPVDISGTVHHDLPAQAPAQLMALFPEATGKTTIKLPQQFNAGIAYRGLAPLTIEAGMRWEGWHSFKELRIDLDQPVAGNTFTVSPRNWKDTYSFMVGGKYDLNPKVALLAGYLYSGNPVPDDTFEPAIPDANVHLFCLGTDITYRNVKISVAYGYQKYQTRRKNNTIDDNPFDGVDNAAASAGGAYRSGINILAISLTYAF
ncbi:MAG: outer membrane protein transport protein [Thermodesulfovibrionales bacterium]